MGDSHYGFSLTTFSPSGKLVQIEYALQAVQTGAPSVGIKAKDGVVLATEHKMPSVLYQASSIEKCAKLTGHVGMVYSGMGPDYRVLVQKARKLASAYELAFADPIPTGRLVAKVAQVCQEYTQSGGVRPFGVSLLLGGWDAGTGTPALYQCDPSGSYFPWKATALGKNYINAKTFLEKRYTENLEVDDAIHLALLTLKESFDSAMTPDNVQLAVVNAGGFKLLSKEELRDHMGAL